MQTSLFAALLLVVGQTEPLGPGDHKRTVTVDAETRTHWIHVPPKYDAKQPAAVVLALHGAIMDGKLMELYCGLSKTADKHNFVVIYPNGTGPNGLFLTWNAGLFPGELRNKGVDDVKYLGKVLDDVGGSVNVDPKRIYAAGLSNGAMMSYRLASEMSDRIAAIAPVAGTIAVAKYEPKRPVPVVHFHGTNDALVPFIGPPKAKEAALVKFRSVADSIQACIQANGCAATALESESEMKTDKLRVVRKEYGKGKNGAEVVLYIIQDGGHTWPGMNLAPALLGPTTFNISANEVMWAFFKKHPMK